MELIKSDSFELFCSDCFSRYSFSTSCSPVFPLFYFTVCCLGGAVSFLRTLLYLFRFVSYLRSSWTFFGFKFQFFFSPFFFSSLPPSVTKSPTPFRHGSPRILLTRYPSNNTVFHGCVTMASPYSPGFSPLSLIILTWLRIG